MQTANAVPANAASLVSATPAAPAHASVPPAMLALPPPRSSINSVILKAAQTVNVKKENKIVEDSSVVCLQSVRLLGSCRTAASSHYESGSSYSRR